MGNSTSMESEIKRREEICEQLGVDCSHDPVYQRLTGKRAIKIMEEGGVSGMSVRKTSGPRISRRSKPRSSLGSKPRSSLGSKPRSKKTSRKKGFGYTHDDYGKTYGVHMDNGILLANDAFSWHSPLDRALNAGGG